MMMNDHKKTIFFFLLLVIYSSVSKTQTLDWNTGFHGFFDNREYFNRYAVDQTMFGSRIFAITGLTFDDRSSIHAGFNYLYEFGSRHGNYSPDIIMYYSYQDRINVNIGVFPRHQLVNQPRILLNDSVSYYRSNLEGIYLGYNRPDLFHNIWIDWTGRISSETREAFIIGGSGKFKKNRFFYEHHFSFYHYALTANPPADLHIHDNGGIVALAGVDLSDHVFLDTLSISSGIAFSYDRIRSVYELRTPLGWYSEFNACFKKFGMSGNLYWGDKQQLLNGDHLYRSGSYQRINFYYLSNRTTGIYARVEFALHFTPGNIDYSQLFVIYMNLDGKISLRKKNNDHRSEVL